MATAVEPGSTISKRAHYEPPWAGVSIVGIAGSSGSGKSSIARSIVQRLNLPWVVILSMDSFYKTLTPEQSKMAFRNEFDFDAPEAIDFEALLKTLLDLKAGKRAEVPVYSFTKHQRLAETTAIYSPHVLILEGIFALHDPRILDMLDMKIFCEEDADVCLSRRILRDVTERGRDVEGIIKQWLSFVKPNFTKFVDPQRKVADIIVPRGFKNKVAITTVVQYIQQKLLEKSIQHQATLSRLELQALQQPVSDHIISLPQTPQLRGMNTIIHDVATSSDDFVFYFDRIAALLIELALNNTKFDAATIATPQGCTYQGLRGRGGISAVVLERGGAALETGLRRVIPDCRMGHILIEANERTAEPELRYQKLARDIGNDTNVLLLDAQMSSGGSALMAVQVLLDHGVPQDHIVLATYSAGRMGLHRLVSCFPEISVVVCHVVQDIEERWIERSVVTMASSSSTSTASRPSFDARVKGVKAPKSHINTLILDYLTMEGYPQAAANFSKEANLAQPDTMFVTARQQIQNYIHMGQIEEAIAALNTFNPEILDQDRTLHFALLRLQLVELIRGSKDGDTMRALTFATEQLGPRAPLKEEFLRDLEQTMSLLFFPPDKLPSELKKLLSPDLRREVADKANKAMLYEHGKPCEAAIRNFLKMRAWAEETARDSHKDLPRTLDIGLQDIAGESQEGRSHQNGHDPMVTT